MQDFINRIKNMGTTRYTRNGLAPMTTPRIADNLMETANYNSPTQALPFNPKLQGSNMFAPVQKPAEVTVYNPDPSQTDARPLEMASGKNIYDGAAASGNRNIPFGQQIYFPGLDKTVTVEDRMNKRYDRPDQHYFDIATTSATPKDNYMARQFGRQKQPFMFVDPALNNAVKPYNK